MTGDTRTRHVIGVMTGTSIDGLDAALVRIDGRGLAMTATLIESMHQPLGDLAGPMREAADQALLPASTFAELAWRFGVFHAEAVAPLFNVGPAIDFIAAHGQTIWHQPPHSWQLLNVAPIVARHRVPVVCDLRQADLAAGGQGAPITPLADWIMLASPDARRAIVNLGGFCNVTVLPVQSSREDASGLAAIRAGDVCICNQLLDVIARQTLGSPFDAGGEHALAGRPQDEIVECIADVLHQQRTGRRSLGTVDQSHDWIAPLIDRCSPQGLAASAVTAIGRTVADWIGEDVDEVVLAGGGAKNRALAEAIEVAGTAVVRPSDVLGVPVDARESMAMAVLGALCVDGAAITLTNVTGRPEDATVAGTWAGLGAIR